MRLPVAPSDGWLPARRAPVSVAGGYLRKVFELHRSIMDRLFEDKKGPFHPRMAGGRVLLR